MPWAATPPICTKERKPRQCDCSGRHQYGDRHCNGLAEHGRLYAAGPVLKLSSEPGEATDIAQCALLLASDDSAYTSGDIIAVDGGWTSF